MGFHGGSLREPGHQRHPMVSSRRYSSSHHVVQDSLRHTAFTGLGTDLPQHDRAALLSTRCHSWQHRRRADRCMGRRWATRPDWEQAVVPDGGPMAAGPCGSNFGLPLRRQRRRSGNATPAS